MQHSRELAMSTHSVSSGTHVFLPTQTSNSRRKRLAETLREWRGRIRSRRELAAMSQLDLKDLGFPPDVEAEKYKPFWRR
jgi:uncharacterized protein YjiS (DUF1127 family)